jgi:sensor histidine kinase YesM
MLFIPFLENAYKYSRIEENEDAYVNIRITEENDKIHFKIENSISQNAKSTPGSGIGINNVIHRLNIIYPGKHKLNIDEQNTYFCVDLVLEL